MYENEEALKQAAEALGCEPNFIVIARTLEEKGYLAKAVHG